MAEWYRVVVVFDGSRVQRYIKGKNSEGFHVTTSYRYFCRLFSRGEAVGLVDRLNSTFYMNSNGSYACLDPVP